MNIFASDEVLSELMNLMMPNIKQAVAETTTPNKTRGSPETESKASGDENTYYNVLNTTKKVAEKSANYGLTVKTYSLDEISNIYDKGNLGGEYDVLFNRLYNFCKNAKITFSVVSEIYHDGKPASGSTLGRSVELNQKTFNNPKVSNKQKSQTILHEMLHTASIYATKVYDLAIKEGVTAQLPKNIYKAAKEINTVYNAISKDTYFTDEYGLQSAEEMVAELSNPYFVSKLKGSYPSGWHQILNGICKLLGINKTFTNYDVLKKAVDRLLSHPDYAIANDYYNSVADKNAYYLDESKYTDLESKGKSSREIDTVYLDAVKSGDMETAQKMVDEAA